MARIINRRVLLRSLGGLALLPLIPERKLIAATNPNPGLLTRQIPATREPIPIIGMGTWLTFDAASDRDDRARCVKVLEGFFSRFCGLVDSSPMYGPAQDVIGYSLARIQKHSGLFSATKVWMLGQAFGIRQMKTSRELWGVPRFDLMQIHNMLDWRDHLETLKQWKADGRIRYIGITTSHGRRHRKLERALTDETFDFVQFTYNVVDREAEQRLLPLAAERGIAVIINRPFRRGALFDRFGNRPLPGWASEFDCDNWAQFFLKFIVSHPAVTCAIPATSQVAHMQENMGAAYGALPDMAMRQRMLQYLDA